MPVLPIGGTSIGNLAEDIYSRLAVTLGKEGLCMPGVEPATVLFVVEAPAWFPEEPQPGSVPFEARFLVGFPSNDKHRLRRVVSVRIISLTIRTPRVLGRVRRQFDLIGQALPDQDRVIHEYLHYSADSCRLQINVQGIGTLTPY